MPRSVLSVLFVALALVPAVGAAGCGGDDEPAAPEPTRPAGAAVRLPFPPTAAEPASAPAPARAPAGRVVRVGREPEGVAFDGETGLVAVGLREPAQLALVEGASGRVRERVELPGAPRHLELAAPGGPVLVPAEDADALVEVDLPGGAARTTAVGDNPHDAAALGDRRATIDEFGSTLSVVRGGRRVRQVPVDAQPGGVVAVGGALAVISVRAYTVELFDDELRPLGSQNAGYGPTHVAADRDGRLYITDTRGGALLVFETAPRLRFVGRVPLEGSPYGLALDARRGRVLVTLTARNELVELTTGAEPREVRRLPTVRQPNTLAVDERTGRIAVASRTDGTLQLIDP